MNSRALYFMVHGVMPARAPRRRRTNRGPARNAKYRAWIRSLDCVGCGRSGSEAAHTGSDGGMRQKASDYSCIPLCTDCHTMGAGAYHRGTREEFEQARGINVAAIVRELNHAWFAHSQEVK